MLYVIYSEDVSDSLEKRAAARPAHIERLKALHEQGRVVIAGPTPAIDSEDPGTAGMTGSPKAISVAVALGDSAAVVAQKAREALAADNAVTAKFSVGGYGTMVELTALTAAANDATLNIAIANGTCAGLTAAPTSANTTAGVAPAV